jgi:hypothetical protein
MRDPSSIISRGAEALIEKYGDWPSFHDCELLRMLLDRRGPCMTLEILMKPAHRLHMVAQFRFNDVDALCLEDFNHQNVISALVIRHRPDVTGDRRVGVEIESVFGAKMTFH